MAEAGDRLSRRPWLVELCACSYSLQKSSRSFF